MLVLSRKDSEGIWIGDDTHVVVVEIRPDAVRLGITAPTTVPVHRDEIYEDIKAEGDREGTEDSLPVQITKRGKEAVPPWLEALACAYLALLHESERTSFKKALSRSSLQLLMLTIKWFPKPLGEVFDDA